MKDSASAAAEEAYGIYLGMIKGPRKLPPWDGLSRSTRGLLEWTARYARFSKESDEPTCPHGQPLHQDCFKCEEVAAISSGERTAPVGQEAKR